MKTIRDIVISTSEPPVHNVAWLQPQSNNTYKLFIYGNNGWTPLSSSEGGGGEGNLSNNEPELLCDLTTTEYVAGAIWKQGDNGQIFDDYKEIYIKMLLQPTENSATGFRISINNAPAWEGNYGNSGSSFLTYPIASKSENTKLCLVHLWKALDGIEQSIRESYNGTTVSSHITHINDSIRLNTSFKMGEINSPEVLEEVSFVQHFECIRIGSYVANMPPNCRFMIYGIK